MKQKNNSRISERVFDLLDPNCLRAVGFVETQLIGPIGALTLDGLKENALKLGYDYCAYREPLRPGKMVVENLRTHKKAPWNELHPPKLAKSLCKNLVETWDVRTDDPALWDMIYPPMGTPTLQYCTALEWLAQRYKDAVVIWVELAITYEAELKLNHAVDDLFYECKKISKNWRVVSHVLGYKEKAKGTWEATL